MRIVYIKWVFFLSGFFIIDLLALFFISSSSYSWSSSSSSFSSSLSSLLSFSSLFSSSTTAILSLLCYSIMCAGPCCVDIIVTHLAWMVEMWGDTFNDASLFSSCCNCRCCLSLWAWIVHLSVDICEVGIGSALLCIPSSWHLASLSFSIASSYSISYVSWQSPFTSCTQNYQHWSSLVLLSAVLLFFFFCTWLLDSY